MFLNVLRTVIMKKFDQLEVIKEKFLAFEENAKNYSFELIKINVPEHVFVPYKFITKDEAVEITLNILDTHNDFVQLYAQASEDGYFFITDDGFIAEEYECQGKGSLFSNHLSLTCKLDEFDEKMQDYFYMLSTLFNFLGFKWDQKNETPVQ